jgi:aryl-alcohol dehydrogenase-like predicted oxidoreductase
MVSGEITPDEAGQVSKLLHERFQRYDGARPAAAVAPLAAARPIAQPTPAQDAPAFSLHRQGEAGGATAIAAPSTIAPFAAPSRSARRRTLAAGLMGSTSLNRAAATG